MHLQECGYYITRISVFYKLIGYFAIWLMALFLQDSLDILIQLIFFLFDHSFDVRDHSFFNIDLIHFPEIGHLAVFSWCDEGNRCSCFPCSSSSSYSMGVSFGILRDSIIDDMGHVVDVDTSCSDIGGD